MAVDWADYGDLLHELSAGTTWSQQGSYSEFRKYLDDNYYELGPDGGKVGKGYESLLAGLLEDMSGNQEEVYKKFRIIALAYPDPDDPGYVASVDFYDQPVRLPNAELYTAGPDAWEPRSAEAAPQRMLDEATGLLYDAENWYTPDGIVVYLDSSDSNWSYDDDGNWYQHGILSAGTAGQAGAAVVSGRPRAGLALDEKSNLRYDDQNWYLPDADIVVYLAPDHPGFSYDSDGNWYEQGKPWTPTEKRSTAAADTEPPGGAAASSPGTSPEATASASAIELSPELEQAAAEIEAAILGLIARVSDDKRFAEVIAEADDQDKQTLASWAQEALLTGSKKD